MITLTARGSAGRRAGGAGRHTARERQCMRGARSRVPGLAVSRLPPRDAGRPRSGRAADGITARLSVLLGYGGPEFADLRPASYGRRRDGVFQY
jgi:hypothetical protein